MMKPKWLNPHPVLGSNALIDLIVKSFEEIEDHRSSYDLPLKDALMSAFALFSLKDPSLLQFKKHFEDDVEADNIKRIYHIEHLPSDTGMREILDEVSPYRLRSAFKEIFTVIQRSKSLKKYLFLDESYLVALDGTGYYSSKKVHCDQCIQKVNKKSGEITYQHQLLGAVIIHPEHKQVIPLAPEAIIKQDGTTKNDCEQNAAKRILANIRKDHPKLRITIVEDGLSSNGPHIREIIKHNMGFILMAKPADHTFLFEGVRPTRLEGRVEEVELVKNEKTHTFRFVNDLPLNAANQDVRVNFLEYQEHSSKTGKTRTFTWVTHHFLRGSNVYQVMKAGRARWKIENETFKTLKHEGYNLEHNFGHGKQYLSTVFVYLMFLAFLIDQVQEFSCPLFKAVLSKAGPRKEFWQMLRYKLKSLIISSYAEMLNACAIGPCIQLNWDTS